jgi:hypothetical protein
VLDDDYGQFFEKRLEMISSEIEKRIIKQNIDKKQQPDILNDYEEDFTTAE